MNYRRKAGATRDGCYFSRWNSAKSHSLDVYSLKRCYTVKDAGRSGAGGAFADRFRGRFVGLSDPH